MRFYGDTGKIDLLMEKEGNITQLIHLWLYNVYPTSRK
jgi:hypothetical protein